MDYMINYVFRHNYSGNIEIKNYSTSQLEGRASYKLSPCFWTSDYTLLARRLHTGMKDSNGKDIFEGTIYQTPQMAEEGYAFKCVYVEETGSYMFDPFKIGDDLAPVLGVESFAQSWEAVKDMGLVIGDVYLNPELLRAEDNQNEQAIQGTKSELSENDVQFNGTVSGRFSSKKPNTSSNPKARRDTEDGGRSQDGK